MAGERVTEGADAAVAVSKVACLLLEGEAAPDLSIRRPRVDPGCGPTTAPPLAAKRSLSH